MAESQLAHHFSSTVTGSSRSPRSPVSRASSYVSSRNTGPASATLLGSPRKEILEVTSKQDNMAACFPQYCATCERLISIPCNSILYCSEACRLKDSAKPLSAAVFGAPASPTSSASSMSGNFPTTAPSSPRAIAGPRSPLGVDAHHGRPATRIPADNHEFKSDLDPTEWKPKGRSTRPNSNRFNSEAYQYLSSFHRSISKSNIHGSNGEYIEGGISFSVPISSSTESTPSLVHTPSTTASSCASVPNLGFDTGVTGAYNTSMYTGLDKNGYDFSTRPLLPRHGRWHSMNGPNGVSIGTDLVTPHVAPAYAKNEITAGVRGGQSGLGTFFGRATARD